MMIMTQCYRKLSLIITSTKNTSLKHLKQVLASEVRQNRIYSISKNNPSAFEWKDELKLVAIYFDTPGFDEITKDTAAKFVDMLSAIGGTFGLLTGLDWCR